jgi:hypothetical protein
MILYIVIAVAGASVYASRWMLKNLKPKANKAKMEKHRLILDMKEQAEALNNPSTYAAYSKFNRKISLMEKELASMPDAEGNNDLYWIVVLMPYFAMFLFVGQTYEIPVAGEDIYWPVHGFLGYQSQKIYHFSLSSWYLISLIVIKSFIG